MTGEEHREQAQGEQHMAAIMREWQTAIPTGGHKAVQQLQREKKKKRARERWSGGGSFKDKQIEGSLSDKSKLTEMTMFFL